MSTSHNQLSDALAAGNVQGSQILLVDDDANLRCALSRVLRIGGYRVFEAANGVDALALATIHHPELAIVDLGLPGMSGYQVVASLREMLGVTVHTAVLSGQSAPEDRVRAFDAGADDFIAKPVEIVELIKKLRAAQRTQLATRNALLAREKAERLQLLNAEASSLLAHDINNGISISIANIQYVRETCPCDEDQLDALLSSEKALRRIAMLTTNFVDISRFEDGVLTPQRTDVDVSALARDTAAVYEPRSAAQDKLIDVNGSPGLIASVDAVLLERVMHNLLGNALRYTTSDGSIQVKIFPVASNREFVMTISNTGPAIPESLRDVLFEKYRTGRDGQAMRGMGLYFCRMACEAHGGSISVSSCNDTTTFKIRIPEAFRGLSH